MWEIGEFGKESTHASTWMGREEGGEGEGGEEDIVIERWRGRGELCLGLEGIGGQGRI